MKFSTWMNNKILAEGKKGKKAQPVQMPKQQSDVIKLSDPSPQRQVSGRSNTSFDNRPKRSRTRGSAERKALGEY